MKSLIKLILIANIFLITSIAEAPKTTLQVANEFAASYATWGHMYERHTQDTYDVGEVRAFKKMVDDFNTLKNKVKLEYEQ